jgi:hypothetical protein
MIGGESPKYMTNHILEDIRRTKEHPKFYLFDTGVFRSLRPRGPLDRPQEIPAQLGRQAGRCHDFLAARETDGRRSGADGVGPVRGGAVQMVVPSVVVGELLDTMFSVRDWVLLGSLAVGAATGMTAALVFALSIRVRRREIETIRKIGGGRQRLATILAAEILVVIVAAVVIAGLLTAVVSRFGELAVRLVGG